MTCTRCSGLVLERYGAFACINCGHDPFLKLITVKCSNPDCFAMPELHNYCARCWHSRVRDPRTEAEKSKAYRERMRLKQQKRREKLKEVASDAISTGPKGNQTETHHNDTERVDPQTARPMFLLPTAYPAQSNDARSFNP